MRICGGCVAIVAEKPRAAEKIARALSGGRARLVRFKGVPLWIFSREGRRYVVIPSAGHLFILQTRSSGVPVFEYHWAPRHLAERGYSHLRRFYEVFQQILPEAVEYINACDYDVEGSVIGYMIISKWGRIDRMKRMRFSTLTEEELKRSFRSLEGPDINMVEAGLARHEMDWIWGINVSRALMILFQRILGERRILSAGRVQTPTLFEIVRNTISRMAHVPLPIYNAPVAVEIEGSVYSLESCEGGFDRRSEAEAFLEAVRRFGMAEAVEVSERTDSQDPPHPFNLGDLQKEAYRLYRISPSKSLSILEDLYLDSLISYPRTNSQRLPPTIEHRTIMEKISAIGAYRPHISKILGKGVLRPNNGPSEDPAHPAIHPTGEVPKRLDGDRARIYDLVVRRYLATFMDPLVVRHTSIVFSVAGRRYCLRGRSVVSRGWLEAYHFYRIEEASVPKIPRGYLARIVSARIRVSYTRPEPPHSKASILRWMEDQGIGTEATRAEIIETLYRRAYVGRSGATDLGLLVFSAIETLFPELSRVELTRQFEELMERIRKGKARREEVVNKTITLVERAVKNFLEKLDKGELGNRPKILGIKVGECPVCGFPAQDRGDGLRLCRIHRLAYENMVKGFERWRENGLSWEEYLRKLVEIRISGSSVKELAAWLSSSARSGAAKPSR